jgi:hypothetical protein
MHRTPHTLAFTALLFLVACPKTNNNVGTIVTDADPIDSDGCPAPKVWYYEEPGCDGQVQPICGSTLDDACAAVACGCDGESLIGCDHYSKPYQSKGLCPGACFSPTHNLELIGYFGLLGIVKGCACDPATEQPQCVAGALNLTCAGGVWNATPVASCDLGTPCDVGAAVAPAAAAYNFSAPECSAGQCLKPAVQTSGGTVDTGAFCTARCSTDNDCAGVTRDPNNPNDKTCTSGYTCGIPFAKGALCCQSFCVCKDFTGGAAIPTPIACQGDGVLTCNQ